MPHPVYFQRIMLPHASPVPTGTHTALFSLKLAAAVPCGLAVTSPRPTMTSTTLATISSSCSRTFTLRLPCSRACLKLMFYTWPLVVDSPSTFSRFRSNIPLHLVTRQFLSKLSSSYSEDWCHTRHMVAMMVKLLGQRSWKGNHISNRTLCGQTSRLRSVNSSHVVLHHSRIVRFE